MGQFILYKINPTKYIGYYGLSNKLFSMYAMQNTLMCKQYIFKYEEISFPDFQLCFTTLRMIKIKNCCWSIRL